MLDNEFEKYEKLDGELQEYINNENEEQESFDDEDYSEYYDSFDDAVEDIDFSNFSDYSNFAQSFSKVNDKIAKKVEAKQVSRPTIKRPIETRKKEIFRKPIEVGRTQSFDVPRQTSRPFIKNKSISRFETIKKPFVKKAFVKKPLTQEFYVKKKATVIGRNEKKLSKVIVPSDRKVIVEGVSKFILSQEQKDDTLKNIGYYKGEKLQELVLTFNNNTPLDFNLELFNPSMPLDYLYSTSLNLNDRITVAGGIVSYTDVLFNLLSNPALLVNAKFVFAGASVNQQLAIPLEVKNKAITGVQKVDPLQLSLQLDTMQFAKDIIFFDMMSGLNRPFIPDGMDVIGYKVLPYNTVTMAFFYKQISLKKVFYEEARNSKKLL